MQTLVPTHYSYAFSFILRNCFYYYFLTTSQIWKVLQWKSSCHFYLVPILLNNRIEKHLSFEAYCLHWKVWKDKMNESFLIKVTWMHLFSCHNFRENFWSWIGRRFCFSIIWLFFSCSFRRVKKSQPIVIDTHSWSKIFPWMENSYWSLIRKFGIIKRVGKGRITTEKNLESWRLKFRQSDRRCTIVCLETRILFNP